MKIQVSVVCCLLVLFLTITSCNKDGEVKNNLFPINNPSSPSQPSGIIVGNREYFWGNAWHRTSNGYAINLNTWRLSDSAINRGINIHVAFWTEMTTFEKTPLAFYNFLQRDTVHLSYIAIPGQLQVIGHGALDTTDKSDVFIEYE